MATEFVAAHVWRLTADGGALASRRPLLNSFIPNVVWLPKQIAKLTDLEGSIVQRTLQEMSWARYRDAEVDPHLREVVEEAWAILPAPTASRADDVDSWNYFHPPETFVTARVSRVKAVLAAADAVVAGDPLAKKVISTRYTEGLPLVEVSALVALRDHLRRFLPADASGNSG